jgi:AcrR family transcriptional regulator
MTFVNSGQPDYRSPMNSVLDPAAIAREPVQQRAKDRFERILKEAEALLAKEGLSGFSIPVLAERLGYTRGSVYAYFPTPYAILNELVKRSLVELEAFFYDRADELSRMPWRDSIRVIIEHAVRFHNERPVARLLILGGAVTDDSFRAQEITVERLGTLGRELMKRNGIRLPANPDVATLSVDIGLACLRRSFFNHGTITARYKEAAIAGMIGFLEPYIERPT